MECVCVCVCVKWAKMCRWVSLRCFGGGSSFELGCPAYVRENLKVKLVRRTLKAGLRDLDLIY